MTALTQPADVFVESFVNYDGSFNPSVCSDPTQNTQIPFQRHVDIRCFIQNNLTYKNGNTFIQGENWIVGSGGITPTVGVLTTYGSYYGMGWPLLSGLNTVSSVTAPVDIYTGFEEMGASSFISLACIIYTPSHINASASYIDFTSDPAGSFSDDTGSLQLSTSLNPINTASVQNVELRFPRNALTGVDLTNITGVRFRLTTTASCTFYCLAIRLLPATWDVAPVDINTRTKALMRSVPKDATLGVTNFPVAAVGGATWPTLYRQYSTTSALRDVTTYTRFYTGQIHATSSNPDQINLYYRSIGSSGVTQGYLNSLTQGQLNGLPQPDTTSAGVSFNALNMGTLDTFAMSYLDTLEMQQLDSIPSSVTGDWLEVDLSWYNTGASLVVKNRYGVNYTFNPTLSVSSYYMLAVTLVGTSINLEIFNTDAAGGIISTNFNSTVINDSSMIVDRSGLIGWWASLIDGDAACYGITTSYTSFGNYLSTPVQSQTPVVGASLYTETTPDKVLANELINGLYGGTVTNDISKSPTAQKIITTGSSVNQGAQTEPFWIYDWNNTVLRFRLFAPSTIKNNPLSIILTSSDNNVTFDATGQSLLTNSNNVFVNIPSYSPGMWQDYIFTFEEVDNSYSYSGYYTFNILGPKYSQTFWIDNFMITSRSYAWKIRDGRFNYDVTDADWVYFLDAHDNINMGASLKDHTTSFQIGGEQLQADALIQGLAIVPYYASRNQLVWAN